MVLKGRLKSIYPYFTVIFVVLISTFVLWLPFLGRFHSWLGLRIENSSFLYIYQHFDGLLYIVAAKTLYNPALIKHLSLELSFSPQYFAAHLPLYPILIRAFSIVFGYLKSMIFVNLLATCLLGCFLLFLLKELKLSQKPLLLTVLFLFFPRFLVVRSVGAPESLFILLILVSLYFFEKEKYVAAGLAGALSAMVKTPGILLFAAYGLVFLEKYRHEKKLQGRYMGILLIPLGFVAVCVLYYFQYGDFLAYFHSGDNIHLVFPYSVFNFQKIWVGTAWLEDIIFYFFLYLYMVLTLKDIRYRSFFYFAVVFFTAVIFVQHRDIARYSLPLWPLFVIAFERFLTSKKFLITFMILLPAIYFYAWNFMAYNVMPVSDWISFL